MKTNSFMLGAAVLAAGGLVAKLIGAVYRIPLTHVLGTEGLGVYQLVFPLYSLLLILSGSGVPTALSKLISERAAAGEVSEAGRILHLSLILFSGIGLVCGLIIFLGADLFAAWQGNAMAAAGFKAIAPAVPLVAVLSCFRGYFQGLSKMSPTAISQVAEQLFKLVLGLSLAYIWGVFGAVLGVMLSEAVAVVYMLSVYFSTRKKLRLKQGKPGNVTNKQLAGQILKTTAPIVLASGILPLILLIDSLVIVNTLKSINYTAEQATILYGLHSGVVNSVVNLPVVLSLAVATALVPAVAGSKIMGYKSASEKVNKAVRVSLIISVPCVIGFVLLTDDILAFLYAGSLSPGSINEPAVAAVLLQIGSASVLLMAMLQIFTSALQGIGKTMVPVCALSAAGVIKLALSFMLISLPGINIYGAAIANLVCFFVAVVINLWFILKHVKLKLSVKTSLLPLVFSGAVMAGVAALLKWGLAGINTYVSLPVIVLSAALVFGGVLYLTGGAEDFLEMFKKRKKVNNFNKQKRRTK
ncbi:MAG: polysaccharide biosynthesis protein [Firmicutes bacterium]|nr:polysaccharide biosynthesis protein [Bacillota bacterium]